MLAAADGDAPGEWLLTPRRAADGALAVEMRHADLERLLRSVVAGLAAKQGGEVQNVQLQLTSRGPRDLAFRAEVTAKMLFMKAAVTLSGDASLDDALNLRLAHLDLARSGMAATLANTFLRPHLDRLQREPIALTMLSFGEVKLRDVEVEAGDSLRIRARFGS